MPALMPVTMPSFETVATPGALLTQVPSVSGDNVVELPTHIVLAPVMLTAGVGLTVTALVGTETQPVAVLVNVKVAEPAETAVITPSLAMVATAGSLLAQVPPMVGDALVISPIQMLLEPTILATGSVTTFTVAVAEAVQPSALVTVTVYVALMVGFTTRTAAELASSQE